MIASAHLATRNKQKMETTETTQTPEAPKQPKKNYGSVLLTLVIVVAILYFGGRYVYDLVKPAAKAVDSTMVAIDSAAVKKDSVVVVPAVDSAKAKADTTKK